MPPLTISGYEIHPDTKCAYARLRATDLSRKDLSSADLSGADLRGANLREAHLMGVALDGANLAGADFGDAKGCYYATPFRVLEGVCSRWGPGE